MNQQELKRQIAAGNISPLYYFYGLNSYLLEETVQLIHAALFTAGAAEFDSSNFDAELHTTADILNAVQTPPLQSAKRLIMVKRADAFKAAQWEQLARCLSKPSSRYCLIFTAIADKPPIGEKYLKILQTHGAVVLFENPRKESVGDLIKKVIAQSGKSITPDALKYLGDEIGTESQVIHQELEKLLLYCRDKKRILREDVEAVLSGSDQQTIFNLIDAIGNRNTEASLKLLNALLDRGIEPLPILGMIARQLRLLAVTRHAVQRGGKNFQIASAINEFNRKVNRGRGALYSRQVENLMKQAQKWSLERISRAYDEISQADVRLKSSRIDKKLILEHLIFQFE